MHKTFSMVVTAFAAMLAASVTAHCADLSSQINDPQLNAAVQRYILCHKQQDYKCVWELLSRRTKDGNDNDQVGYEKYVKSHGFHPSDFVVNKSEESTGTATLTVAVTYVNNATGKAYASTVEEWKFVNDKGSWLFDDYRTLSESP